MNREEFLAKLGISLATVCVGGCLAACGKDETGSPSTITITPPSNVSFAIDLNTELKNVGDSKISNGVIVVRTSAGSTASSFTAVQVACSHEGTSIGYSSTQGKFICPNHGSQFSNTGAVLVGPATASLKSYSLAITGSTLIVTG